MCLRTDAIPILGIFRFAALPQILDAFYLGSHWALGAAMVDIPIGLGPAGLLVAACSRRPVRVPLD